jgi:hypothetical protein
MSVCPDRHIDLFEEEAVESLGAFLGRRNSSEDDSVSPSSSSATNDLGVFLVDNGIADTIEEYGTFLVGNRSSPAKERIPSSWSPYNGDNAFGQAQYTTSAIMIRMRPLINSIGVSRRAQGI